MIEMQNNVYTLGAEVPATSLVAATVQVDP